MRLLLTSNGFPKEAKKIREEFFRLVGKKPADIKVAFIPTASIVENDRSFMEIDRKEIEDMGIPKGNITDLELDHPITITELVNYDVILVDGGNTFYLLEKARESGFDKAIDEYLKEDQGVYVGISAGTVFTGPDVSFVEPWDDKSKAKLDNTRGLAYTKEAYSPHYKDEEKTILDEEREKRDYPIIELRDGQAITIDKDGQKTIF